MARYERVLIDSFSTWHTGAGVDIDETTGSICVINDNGLFLYHREQGTYTRLPAIAALKTSENAACVCINRLTGEIVVAHKSGLNLYQPKGSGYSLIEVDNFSKPRTGARCAFHENSGDIVVVNDTEGFCIFWERRQ